MWRVGAARSNRPIGSGWRSGFAGEERVAEHFVGTRFVFAGRAAEGVDRGSCPYVDETYVLEHHLPARTGQPAGDSTSPQIDVPKGCERNGPAVGDIGELQPTARA